MTKKKGVISNLDKMEELSNAENALRRMQAIEAKRKNTMNRIKILKGYVLTTNKEKWEQN